MAPHGSLQDQLSGWGLLKAGPEIPEGPDFFQTLLRLCFQGGLRGGLSVAHGVQADELWGPLCAEIGGGALQLRIRDVRSGPPEEIFVEADGREEGWLIDRLTDLPERLNQALAGDSAAKPVAVLGEWEDALELWCLERRQLSKLLKESWFRPENREELLTRAKGSR